VYRCPYFLKVFVLKPAPNGLNMFFLSLQRQPVTGWNARYSEVSAGCTHRVALTISGDAADLISLPLAGPHSR
jgi:hypothetical protein